MRALNSIRLHTISAAAAMIVTQKSHGQRMHNGAVSAAMGQNSRRTNRMQATARWSVVVFMVVICSPSPDPRRSADSMSDRAFPHRSACRPRMRCTPLRSVHSSQSTLCSIQSRIHRRHTVARPPPKCARNRSRTNRMQATEGVLLEYPCYFAFDCFSASSELVATPSVALSEALAERHPLWSSLLVLNQQDGAMKTCSNCPNSVSSSPRYSSPECQHSTAGLAMVVITLHPSCTRERG